MRCRSGTTSCARGWRAAWRRLSHGVPAGRHLLGFLKKWSFLEGDTSQESTGITPGCYYFVKVACTTFVFLRLCPHKEWYERKILLRTAQQVFHPDRNLHPKTECRRITLLWMDVVLNRKPTRPCVTSFERRFLLRLSGVACYMIIQGCLLQDCPFVITDAETCGHLTKL